MEAAVEALASVNSGAGILAITVLTSLGPDDLARTGLGNSPGKVVARLSKLAKDAGTEGVVCAVKELGDVAQAAPGLLRVTPGIRPAGSDPGDQSRTAEPAAAIARGADYLVIGRPIIANPNPEEAAIAIRAELGLE
jgi:orotidine-5'-phosphate decarboxylase